MTDNVSKTHAADQLRKRFNYVKLAEAELESAKKPLNRLDHAEIDAVDFIVNEISAAKNELERLQNEDAVALRVWSDLGHGPYPSPRMAERAAAAAKVAEAERSLAALRQHFAQARDAATVSIEAVAFAQTAHEIAASQVAHFIAPAVIEYAEALGALYVKRANELAELHGELCGVSEFLTADARAVTYHGRATGLRFDAYLPPDLRLPAFDLAAFADSKIDYNMVIVPTPPEAIARGKAAVAQFIQDLKE